MKRILWTLLTVVLTAKLGTVQFEGHAETYYNLPMDNVISRSDEMMGLSGMYHIREDGVKMYGPWVICAAHPSKIRYTRIPTSLGEGIILDTHEMPDTELVDIAVNW